MVGLLDVKVPVVLVFHRKGIRIFSDGTRVATYHNDRIKRTITIPFSEVGVGLGEEIVNELKTKTLQSYIKNSREDREDDRKTLIRQQPSGPGGFRGREEYLGYIGKSGRSNGELERKLINRSKGVGLAKKKLETSTNEDFGPVNELSKGTLVKYVRKSALDVADKNYAVGYRTSKRGKTLEQPIRTKNEKRKWNSRIKGINIATRKLSEMSTRHTSEQLKKISDELTEKIKIAVDRFRIKLQKEVAAVKYVPRRRLKESDENRDLKQVKKWINNTRVTQAAGEYNGSSGERFVAHLRNLNKDKKNLKSAVKAKFAERNASRTETKNKNQLSLKI